MRKILKNRPLILKIYTVVIALGFVGLQLLNDRSPWNASLYFLIMTASLPIGPIIDLIFFKIGNDFPRLGWLFNILLPILVIVGAFVQWKYILPWTMARLARVRRERSRTHRP